MGLTAAQRNALPRAAFVYSSGPRSRWAYPAPTRGQVAAANRRLRPSQRITETRRAATHRAALAYSARADTRGTHRNVRAHVTRRHQGAVASVAARSASRPRAGMTATARRRR